MTIRQKLEVIRKATGLTQTKLAEKLGVSFPAFNAWWTGKSVPRPGALAAIEALFLEVTGQKTVPQEQLAAKQRVLIQKSTEYKSVLRHILDNPDIHDEFVLRLTYHTNRIEGSTLTKADTAAILFDNAALPNKTLIEQLEAKNHQTALEYMFRHVLAKGELEKNFLLRLHGILMNGIRPDAGAYRNHPVRIVGVNLPTANHLKVPDLVPAVLREADTAKKDSVLYLGAKVHSRFEQIHPFSDGNGRIGRLLLNAMLLQANMAPAVIREEQKRLYYTYLYKAQSKDDQSQLEDFIYDAVLEGFSILERSGM